MHFRNLLSCLCPALFFLQQILGWLKFPVRTKAKLSEEGLTYFLIRWSQAVTDIAHVEQPCYFTCQLIAISFLVVPKSQKHLWRETVETWSFENFKNILDRLLRDVPQETGIHWKGKGLDDIFFSHSFPIHFCNSNVHHCCYFWLWHQAPGWQLEWMKGLYWYQQYLSLLIFANEMFEASWSLIFFFFCLFPVFSLGDYLGVLVSGKL